MIGLLSAPPAVVAPALTSDQVLGYLLLDLLLILVLARIVGAAATRIGQPRVVGEIVAGILLGPTILGPKLFALHNPPKLLHCQAALGSGPMAPKPSISSCLFPTQSQATLSIIGSIALVLFMFLVGFELDFASLKGKYRGILTLGVGVIITPLVFAFAIAGALFNKTFVGNFGAANQPSKTGFTLLVAAMLAVTAFPVMARILQEKGLTMSTMGATGIAAAALVTVLMFLLVAVARGISTKAPTHTILLTFLWTALYLAVAVLVVRPLLAPVGKAFLAAGRLTPGVLAVIFLVIFASAYVAQIIGINVIVGGFVAGAIMPARKELFAALSVKLSDFTAAILLPVFLAFSGLRTDFTKLTVASIGGIALFLVAGIVAKWGGGILFARAGGLSWGEGNVLGVLMNCRGLLVLVVALIGFNAGVISAPLQVGGVVMALVTTMMTGPLFDWSSKRLAAKSGAIPPPAGRTAAGLAELPDDPLASLQNVEAAHASRHLHFPHLHKEVPAPVQSPDAPTRETV